MAQDRTLRPALPAPPVRVPWHVATGLLALFAIAILAHPGVARLAPLVAAIAAATLIWRELLAWRGIVAMLVLIILFVPFRRYELPSALPFNLEPYRLFVAVVALLWIASLLVDSRVRLRSTPIDPPLITLLIVCGLSIVANGSRVQELGVGTDALKQLTFLTSFVIVFYFVASVVVDREGLDMALSLTVGGAALVAASSLVEYRTGFNAFSHLDKVVPFLKETDALSTDDVQRLGRLRVYGSAQHPIALGAAFVLLIPFSVYLARMRRVWLVATALLFLGAMGTLSRTAVVMLVSVVAVFLVLRPRWSIDLLRRFWILFLPAVIAFHFLLPGTIGTFEELFFPQGGLVAEQQAGSVGSSRGALLHAGRRFYRCAPCPRHRLRNTHPRRPREELLHHGRPVGCQRDGDWSGRARRDHLAVPPNRADLLPRCAGGRVPAWVPIQRGDRGGALIRGRNDLLRRVLVHPGDPAALSRNRARLRRTPRPRSERARLTARLGVVPRHVVDSVKRH